MKENKLLRTYGLPVLTGLAVGAAAVLLTLGSALYYAIRRRGLDVRLFGAQ